MVEYEDGRKDVIEVKDPSRVDSDDVQRKRKAAEMWCKQRKMEYTIATIGWDKRLTIACNTTPVPLRSMCAGYAERYQGK
ncbi:MAG: hypothetical protein L6437_02060 [Kiritimatiellae bacterium]|nr:hypothetical protein [Kiritimatiellia bacterium]